VDIYTIYQEVFTTFNMLKINYDSMNRIKEVLQDKGISQTWLANKMEKSYNTINEYARNVRQPSLEDLYKISEILDVDIKVLIVSKKKKI
jgi:putative transcriptional regulator